MFIDFKSQPHGMRDKGMKKDKFLFEFSQKKADFGVNSFFCIDTWRFKNRKPGFQIRVCSSILYALFIMCRENLCTDKQGLQIQ